MALRLHVRDGEWVTIGDVTVEVVRSRGRLELMIEAPADRSIQHVKRAKTADVSPELVRHAKRDA